MGVCMALYEVRDKRPAQMLGWKLRTTGNMFFSCVKLYFFLACFFVFAFFVATLISTHVYATFQTVNLIKKLFENFN